VAVLQAAFNSAWENDTVYGEYFYLTMEDTVSEIAKKLTSYSCRYIEMV